jgi:hypothetical protein
MVLELELVLAPGLSVDASRALTLIESVCAATSRKGLAGWRLAVSVLRETCSVAQPAQNKRADAHRPLAIGGIFERPDRLISGKRERISALS